MLMDRVVGVFRLDADTFEEIEADRSATGQAALVVLFVALLAGAGSGFASGITDQSFVSAFVSTFVGVFTGWILWSVATYFVGTQLFDGQADMPEMLRVIGFAHAPQLLGVIPCIGWLIGIIWTLAAGFVAVRQGLDLDNTKAVLTIGIGFVVFIILNVVLNFALRPLGL